MKRIIFLLTFIAFSLIHFKTNSQTNWCGDFSITGITNESIDPNILQISIAFSASTSTFANYPYISAIIDCQGDTVATGNMFWFGQFGQSTIDYPVLSNGTSPCEPFSAVFIYADNAGASDTCILSGGSSSLENREIFSIHAFPNPTNNQVQILVPDKYLGSTIGLFDITGKLIYSSPISAGLFSIDLEKCEKGTYVLRLLDNTGAYFTKLMVP